MRTRRATRYICSYCSRGFWEPFYCLGHEERCFSNPSRVPEQGELYPWTGRRFLFDRGKRGGFLCEHQGVIWPRWQWDDAAGDRAVCEAVDWEPEERWEPNEGRERTHIYWDGEWREISLSSWVWLAEIEAGEEWYFEHFMTVRPTDEEGLWEPYFACPMRKSEPISGAWDPDDDPIPF